MPAKHIAIYVRVSSTRQDTRSQEPDLIRYAEDQDGPVKFYRDKSTGKTMDRPEWNKLEALIRSGHVKTLVVWRLDRLGRTASGLTALFEELQRRKVNFVSLKDGVDLSTPAGRLMANVLASVAAYENEVRSERIRAGQAVARANGKRWGGGTKGKRTRATPDKVKIIHQLRKEGTSVARIALALDLSRPTVYDVLRAKA